MAAGPFCVSLSHPDPESSFDTCDSIERLTQDVEMLFAVVADQRFHNRLFAGFDAPVPQLCQFVRIAFSRQDRIYDRQPCGSRQDR